MEHSVVGNSFTEHCHVSADVGVSADKRLGLGAVLVMEDRSKAKALLRSYASVSSHTRHPKRDRAVKADLKRAPA